MTVFLEWFARFSPLLQFLLLYLTVINIVTFFSFGFDKRRSLTIGAPRIRERTLWLLTLFGGSLGALLGMKLFRHKTKKVSFQGMMLLILLVQILAVWVLFLE